MTIHLPAADWTSALQTNATAMICGSMLATVLFFSASSTSFASEEAVMVPPPAMDQTKAPSTETAVLAGGCFWGMQGVFQHVKGVSNAVSGYAGGAAKTAQYEAVGSGKTGHAESVRITFDPKTVSYGTLLQVYFSVAHNPTELNRQGPDTGTQYRSTIFAQSGEQKKVAEAYIRQLDKAKVYGAPVVTTIETGKSFYAAEQHHQDYATLHPESGYISTFDLPKIASLHKMFPSLYRAKPRLVADAAIN